MRTFLIVSALFLAACQMPADEPTAEKACGADTLQHLVGAPVSAADGESAPGSVRVIRPGQAVTMDYLSDRVNFELDGGDRISRVYCG